MLLLCLVSVSSLAAPAIPFQQGFENDAAVLRGEGWRLHDGCAVETHQAKAGEGCLRVDVPEARRRYADVFLPVEAGKFYCAEAWMRCDDVQHHRRAGQNRGAVIFCQWADHYKRHVSGGSFPKGLHGTHDWTLLRVPYTRRIPDQVGYIQLMLGVEGIGTAWFDEVRVEELTGWAGPQVVAPADRAVVDVRRPLLEWAPLEGASGATVVLSPSADFPEAETVTVQAEGAACRPPEALAPGPWYWRIVAQTDSGPLPPGAAHAFTIAADAPVWPVEVTPAWAWSEASRPVLEATVHPLGAPVEIAAFVDGAAAEVLSCDDGVVRFRPGGDLAPGLHEVRLEVTGAKGRSATSRGVFCNKPPARRVSVRDDNILLVDGEPFFPLGAYRDPSDSLTEFDGLLEAGFNVTHNYLFEDGAEPSPDVARAYLDAAHAHGLMVFMGFFRPRIADLDWAWLERWAAELMDAPGLLTWYLRDEPAGQGVSVAAMKRFNRGVKAVDPFHPTSVVVCRPAAFERYARATDILWNDPYPVPSRPLSMVDDWVRQGRAVAGPDQPYWTVLQAHDLRYWNDYEKAVERHGPVSRPTYEESRCMAFTALAGGANGLIWYWGPNRMYHMRDDAPAVWQGLCDLLRELNGLMPWLVAHRTAADEVAVPEPLRAWCRLAKGRRILALVNTANKAVRARVDLSAFQTDLVRIRGGAADQRLDGGHLPVAFGPHEVQVYEWAPGP